MDVLPAVFSASFANMQSGEYDMSPALFYQDSISTPNNLVQNAINISRRSDSDKCSGEHNSKRPWAEIDGMEKKCLHRLTERERRKHMRSMYSQLTSLLPQKNIRGKTSINDQLCNATEYIRSLQGKVDELAKKRDDIKRNKKQYCDRGNGMPFNECEIFRAPVNVRHVGSSAVVTTSTLREQMALSEVVVAVEEGGLQILTATSFTTDRKIFHALHCKVLDMETFKSSAKLQQKI